MMTSQEGFNVDNEGPVLDPTTSDDSPFIANAAELERFASEPSSSQITPEIRGVIAEVALTGLRRYPWQLLSPILHRLLDSALDSFNSIGLGEDEAGPPRPMPDGGTLDQSRSSLHSMLDDFATEPPFTIQRLCEIILEPRKQYSRIEKFIVAVERLLLVTSTVGTTAPEDLPPLPQLSTLEDVNENKPSPYDGEPPAGPQPSIEDRLQPMGNGIMDSDEYAIFVGAETGQHGTGELVAIDAHGSGVAVGSPILNSERLPTPMEPAEVIQAEAFVHAALGTSVSAGVASGGVGEMEEPVAEAVAAAVAAAVVHPVMEAAAAAATVETQAPFPQQQQVAEEVVVGQPISETGQAPTPTAAEEEEEEEEEEPILNNEQVPSSSVPPEEQKADPTEPKSVGQQPQLDRNQEELATDAPSTTTVSDPPAAT